MISGRGWSATHRSAPLLSVRYPQHPEVPPPQHPGVGVLAKVGGWDFPNTWLKEEVRFWGPELPVCSVRRETEAGGFGGVSQVPPEP